MKFKRKTMYRYSNSSFRNVNKVRICRMLNESIPKLLPDPEYFPYLLTCLYFPYLLIFTFLTSLLV